MQYRAWRSARDVVSYQEGDLRCDFDCAWVSTTEPQVLYLHDRCTFAGQERKLALEELARIEERLRKYLTERRFFGFKLGMRELQVVHQQSL
jgi:hypothetical protein